MNIATLAKYHKYSNEYIAWKFIGFLSFIVFVLFHLMAIDSICEICTFIIYSNYITSVFTLNLFPLNNFRKEPNPRIRAIHHHNDRENRKTQESKIEHTHIYPKSFQIYFPIFMMNHPVFVTLRWYNNKTSQ